MSKVSVIIPAFNAERFIQEALESVFQQTFRDVEVVVVNDGSTDGTCQAVQPYLSRIVYVEQENKKLPTARNAGAAASSGEYLAFLDADDCFLPEKLAQQVAYLDAHPAVGLVASGYDYVDADGSFLRRVESWRQGDQITLLSLLRGGLTAVHAVLMRREWFERVGGFDPAFAHCEDMDFWYRLGLANCPMAWLPQIVCQYRMHGQNMTARVEPQFKYYFQALDNVFQRADLPAEVQQVKDPLYAAHLLAAAGHFYLAGDYVTGQRYIENALERHPDLRAEKQSDLLGLLAGWLRLPRVADRETFLNTVIQHLPSSLDQPAFPQRLRKTAARQAFYDAHASSPRSPRIARYWMSILRREPAWLFNRGGWSILFQSLGLKKGVVEWKR